VDDGLATGSTMRAAVEALRQSKPAQIIVAVPVGAADTVRQLHTEADGVVCLRAPVDFHAVSNWYKDFSQTSDEEVRGLLEEHSRMVAAAPTNRKLTCRPPGCDSTSHFW
jgi:putative phosphoribosyl transferase